MYLKYCITFYFILLTINIYSQDPGTVISIDLINGGKKVSSANLQEYAITVQMVKPKKSMYDEKTDYTGDNALFHFFDWVPYRGEIYEIIIVHSQDTMNVRFQMNLDTIFSSRKPDSDKYIWNAVFYMEIPFQTGYFEIIDFVLVKYSTYRINDAHVWLPLAPENRKLNADHK